MTWLLSVPFALFVDWCLDRIDEPEPRRALRSGGYRASRSVNPRTVRPARCPSAVVPARPFIRPPAPKPVSGCRRI